jgi:hypothetical protein
MIHPTRIGRLLHRFARPATRTEVVAGALMVLLAASWFALSVRSCNDVVIERAAER